MEEEESPTQSPENLLVEDIDLENKKLKVVDSKFSMRTKTKYGKDRYVVIPDMMIGQIKRWLDIMACFGFNSKIFLYLFVEFFS